MLSWENLAKSYGRRRLFSGITGELPPGSGLIVTGCNGSGKSTLLKVLVGLARPDTGTVHRPPDRHSIGYAAPHMSLYGELTGLENLQFYGALRGADSQPRASYWMDRLGLRRAENKPASVYSTGMIQRLRIACALIHEPSLLILDEPTIGLDRDGVAFVEEVVAEHADAGAGGGAVIVATNDPGHFAAFTERWPTLAMGV